MRRFMRNWVSRNENGSATRFTCMHALTAYYEHIYIHVCFEHYPEIATTNLPCLFFSLFRSCYT